MPIQSYLVYPTRGNRDDLINTLNAISDCEVTESTNEDIFILLTDTENEEKEYQLQDKLKMIPGIQGMVLVYAQEG